MKSDDELCERCGHGWNAHAHYRAGSDCVLCPCPRFRRRLLPWRRRPV